MSLEMDELFSCPPLPLSGCQWLSGGKWKITDLQQFTRVEELLVFLPQYSFISFSSVFPFSCFTVS